MASKTDICNMALSHLSSGKEIANVEIENSAEARAFRRFYDTALEELLRDYDWPFATKFKALGLVEESPTSEWAYSYTYPSDCLYFRRILSGSRNDSLDSRVPYRIVYGDSGQLIYSDQSDAESEYTVRVTDTNRYPPDFVTAFSFLLASYVAPRIAGADPYKLRETAVKLAQYAIAKAAANAKNENTLDQPVDAEMIRARE